MTGVQTCALPISEEAKTKAENHLREGGDISEDEARILNQSILYSQAQIRAKRRKRN